MKTHKQPKAEKPESVSGLYDNYLKVHLKRRQYIKNLLMTNQEILRSNNINTLLLF
ncbi:hypothetical protein [Flavobacterium sp.]|uniref:hypothetical protein n=1 Tax=Flavobacterium sp. TaxID=239 RepID=UPI0025B7C868|nr:hypothetical protein [Flavobacterium sp.]